MEVKIILIIVFLFCDSAWAKGKKKCETCKKCSLTEQDRNQTALYDKVTSRASQEAKDFLAAHECRAVERNKICSGMVEKIDIRFTCKFLAERRSMNAAVCADMCSAPICMRRKEKKKLQNIIGKGKSFKVVNVKTTYFLADKNTTNDTVPVDLITDCHCELAKCVKGKRRREKPSKRTFKTQRVTA